MPSPKGLDALEKRLKNMRGAALRKRIGSVLYAAGEMVAVEAQLSISAGAVSGKNHVPSAPGKPPNYDSGVLANGIIGGRAHDVPGGIGVRVTSNAPYAAHLEYGTSKMAARPYMRPAADKVAPTARRLIAIAVRAAGKVK